MDARNRRRGSCCRPPTASSRLPSGSTAVTTAPGANLDRLTSSQWPGRRCSGAGQLTADRVDGDVHAPVVLVVRRRQPPPVHRGPGSSPPPCSHSRTCRRRGSARPRSGPASWLQVGHGDRAVCEHEVEAPVARQVDPRVAPARLPASARGREHRRDVCEAQHRLPATERRVALPTRVRDEQVGRGVARVVLGRVPIPAFGSSTPRLAPRSTKWKPSGPPLTFT